MDNTPSHLKIHHLSFSQLQLYQKCPFKYYLQYVQKVYPKSEPIEFVIGSAFHKGMEEMYKYRDFQKGKGVFREQMRDYEDIVVDNLTSNMSLYSNFYMPKYEGDTVGTEVRFELNIPKVEVPIVGVIDNLQKRGFIDYKTTSSYKAKETYDIKQLATYALWFFSKFKVLPEVCEIHNFNKLIIGEKAITIVREKITHEMINMVMLEYIQFWQDIKNERWTPNMAAWSANDNYYDLACEYADNMTL